MYAMSGVTEGIWWLVPGWWCPHDVILVAISWHLMCARVAL